MAKIALDLERALAYRAAAGTPGRLTGCVLAQGDGWIVEDVICTCGPGDRPFEEQHSWVSIAVVVSGTFQYRGVTSAGAGPELMTPGSLLLGNPGQYFECAHAHGMGDRCISFRYAPAYFANLAGDVRPAASGFPFRRLRVPPVPRLSALVARSCAGLVSPDGASWEELSVQLAARALGVETGLRERAREAPREAVARVTRTVRAIERHPDAGLTLGALARSAGLSSYHFLRTFERVTGVTPHRYVLRTRLRHAAMRLAVEPTKIVDIALESGFGDVSNFNRNFRAEFGVSPRAFRMRQK